MDNTNKLSEKHGQHRLLIFALVGFGLLLLLAWLYNNDKLQTSENSSFGADKDYKIEWVYSKEERYSFYNEYISFLKVYPELIHSFTPRQFEEFIAYCFEKLGYNVELTRATKDGGRDIIVKYKLPCGNIIVGYIECKLYSKHRSVGVQFVRSLRGVVADEKVNFGMIITTAKFTKEAKNYLSKTGNIISLCDVNKIISCL